MFVAPCFHFVCSGLVFFCVFLLLLLLSLSRGVSSQMHWKVARTLMKSGYVNCFGHFLRFSHQPSFATQQQVPRFQGSSVAVPFWFVGLAKTTRSLPDPEIETQQSLLLWITVTAVGRCTICIDIEYYNGLILLYTYVYSCRHAYIDIFHPSKYWLFLDDSSWFSNPSDR